MTINKRVKRIFMEHKATYIGMAILIILSTSCFLGLKTAASSISKNVDENRIEANVEDANFSFSKELTETEITKLEPDFNLAIEKNKQIEFDYNNAVLRIRPEAKRINKAANYDGEYLKNSNDIMVDRFFYEAQDLKFGDKIQVNEKEYNVCGVFTTPDYLSLLKSKTDFISDGNKFGLCLVSESTFEKLQNGTETTNYSVVFNEDNKDNFRKELAKSGVVIGWTDKDSNIRITTFDGEISAIIMLSRIAPLFILIISSLIMAVVLNRMLQKEYVYIGTLTALGYRKREITRHYLMLPMVVSIAGSLIGIVIGYFLTGPFSGVSSVEYSIPKPIFYYHWEDIALILLVPLILNTLAALLAVKQALHVNIVALLKSNAGKLKKGAMTRFVPHKKGSFKLRFKLKEMISNIPRSLLMIVGIAAASMFLLTGFMFNGAIDFLFKSNFHEMFGYNYQYVLNQPLTENNTKGEPYMASSFDYIKDKKTLGFTIFGVADNSKYIKLYDDNKNPISQDKTVITQSVANRLDIKKGDTITIKNNSNLKEYEIKIDDICDISYSENVYMPLNKLNKILELPETMYVGLYSNKLLDVDEKLVTDILTIQDSKAGLETSIAAFKVFLYILAFVSAVVGIVVVYIVTVMLIEENRKNISMLKVIGYHNREISRLLLNSTSALVWLGFIIAVPMTFTVIQAFFNMLTENMYFSFDVKLKLWQGVSAFAFILATYYITLFFAKKKILNINMAESLKARE
ncbi:MAG: FtsX-like permease family protein [Oscillospiraceae bacterium]